MVKTTAKSCFFFEISSLSDFVSYSNLKKKIGERGSKISGGQRQRVALAKALYRGRPVVILDEATSALDEQMQTEVLKNLKSVKDRPAILLVTHRLNSLKYCDRIYKMRNGYLEIEK